MDLVEPSRSTFKRLLPRAGFFAFEVIGGVFSLFWVVVMIISAFRGAALGMGIAEHQLIPALGLADSSLGWIAHGTLALGGALAGIVIVAVIEIIVLILVLLAVAGVIALAAGATEAIKPTSSQ